MKRSEINGEITWAEELLARNNIRLPDMAYWPLAQYKASSAALDVVRKVELGWDITDFGCDDLACAALASPGLTTVHQPCADIARTAFNFLVMRIENPSLPSRECALSTPLVVRDSTK